MSKPLHLALMTTALILTLALPAHAGDTVVAIVNGDKIYKKDVMRAVDSLPIKDAKIEQIYPMVIDQIVNEKLIDDATAAAKIAETAEYKKRLGVIQAQLVKQIYLEQAVEGKISDKAVKSAYDKFKKENAGKTELHARHILVPSEEEAIQVIKDLDGGASFEELANKRSSGPSAQNGGDLGYFTKEEMVPEFSAAAFKLKEGEYTKKPVKSSFGWHVIKAEDRREREVPSLEQVEMPIRNKLGQDALAGLIAELRKDAKVELFDLNGEPVKAATKVAE